jgi:hypothetical protein
MSGIVGGARKGGFTEDFGVLLKKLKLDLAVDQLDTATASLRAQSFH